MSRAQRLSDVQLLSDAQNPIDLEGYNVHENPVAKRQFLAKSFFFHLHQYTSARSSSTTMKKFEKIKLEKAKRQEEKTSKSCISGPTKALL